MTNTGMHRAPKRKPPFKIWSWKRNNLSANDHEPSTLEQSRQVKPAIQQNEVQPSAGEQFRQTPSERRRSSQRSMVLTSIVAALPPHEPTSPMHIEYPTPAPTAEQIEALIRLHSHRIINTLYHSAHNSETTTANGPDMKTWNIELRYPSGYSERFSFSNPTKRGARSSARAVEVVQDIKQTVEVILRHSTCDAQIRNNINLRLHTAWNHNSFDLFKAAVETVNNIIMEKPIFSLSQLPTEMVHHFFDQLYDRAVSPHTRDLNKGRAGFTYGEIKPSFLTTIFKQVGLDRSSVYLDLGSGIGNTVMQAALETGCEAHGIEIQHYAHLVSVNHMQQFHARAILWGLEPGQVQLYFGNFLHSPLVDDLLSTVDVVLVNNVKFDPSTDEQLRSLLGRCLKVGAKVVSMRPLAPAGRLRGVDRLYETECCEYEKDWVSWTNNSGLYYIATKQCVAR